ncbi:hypothetical protein HDU93_001846 [Gonapodya sp. JEL0774]|nr:hypothetical protein HDU93_001846 [Gonapodya sp. JEL0774]
MLNGFVPIGMGSYPGLVTSLPNAENALPQVLNRLREVSQNQMDAITNASAVIFQSGHVVLPEWFSDIVKNHAEIHTMIKFVSETIEARAASPSNSPQTYSGLPVSRQPSMEAAPMERAATIQCPIHGCGEQITCTSDPVTFNHEGEIVYSEDTERRVDSRFCALVNHIRDRHELKPDPDGTFTCPLCIPGQPTYRRDKRKHNIYTHLLAMEHHSHIKHFFCPNCADKGLQYTSLRDHASASEHFINVHQLPRERSKKRRSQAQPQPLVIPQFSDEAPAMLAVIGPAGKTPLRKTQTAPPETTGVSRKASNSRKGSRRQVSPGHSPTLSAGSNAGPSTGGFSFNGYNFPALDGEAEMYDFVAVPTFTPSRPPGSNSYHTYNNSTGSFTEQSRLEVGRPRSASGSIGGYDSDASGGSGFWGHSDVEFDHRGRHASLGNISSGYLSPNSASRGGSPVQSTTATAGVNLSGMIMNLSIINSATAVGEPTLLQHDPFLTDGQQIDGSSLNTFGMGGELMPATPTLKFTYFPPSDGGDMQGNGDAGRSGAKT